MAAGLGVAGMGKKIVGRTIAAASVNTAGTASTYTRALQDGTRAAMRDAGVDFKDPKAVASWVKENPEISDQIAQHALQSVLAGLGGKAAGSQVGNRVKNPVGSFAAEQTVSEGVKRAHEPKERTDR